MVERTMDNSKRFAHMVYFTLKDTSDAACDALISACKKYLSDHEGTVFFAAGRIAGTNRDVVDKNYQVGLQLVFQDRAAHDAYQVAPQHDAFIAEQKHNWEQVRVFDTILAND